MEINTVFVIIVTYNGKQWYDRCFESLRLSVIPIQTIVIDNASSDDTIKYIKSNYPEVYLIKSDINLGFGQANNLGIKYALQNNADYVFLLNQDAWIEPNSISGLIKIHADNNEYGILSPIHLNLEKQSIEKGLIKYIADFRVTNSDLINDLYFNRLKDVYETKYINAASWLIPRNTIEIVGGFDPIFFHYGEDDNYMHRIFFHGLKLGICPQLKVVHDTERQVIRLLDAQKSNSKLLLTQYTNINFYFGAEKIIIYYFRKAVVKFLKLDFKQAKYYLMLLKFIFQNKSNIKKSRSQNVLSEKSWL